MNQLIGIPKAPPKLTRLNLDVHPQELPMIATILPAKIIGSKQADGFVRLVIEGPNLPSGTQGALKIERDGNKVTVEIVARH